MDVWVTGTVFSVGRGWQRLCQVLDDKQLPHSSYFNQQCTIYKDVSKSSRTVLVKRSLLTLDVKFLHNLQSTPLLHEYSGPSVSAMLGSIPGSPFLELYQVPAAIPLESFQWCRIFDPLSEAAAWGRGKSHRGQIGWVWGMGDHCHAVLGQKLRNFKGHVSRSIVVLDYELLVLPFLWPLAPHIFT